MKRIKLFEDINWDEDWEIEESPPINKEELIKYNITFDNIEQCRDIAKKLKDLGYKVYNYDVIFSEEWNGFSDNWCRFIYVFTPPPNSNKWRRNQNAEIFKNDMTYNDFMKL